jgi:hypothetical protein
MAAKKSTIGRILNCLHSKDKEKDWQYEHAVASKILKISKAVQRKVDLRESWWKINNQDLTGSCVGWAAADSVFRWHFVKAGRIAKSEPLSVRFIWMGAKEIDQWRDRPTGFLEQEGTSLKAALDMGRKYGNVPDSVLPFSPSTMNPDDPDAFYSMAANFKIASYFNLRREGTSWETTLEKWRNWLSGGGGPILTRLDCDEAWFYADETDGYLESYEKPPDPAGHAVAIVGYSADHFIVRNSWGSDWGKKGFAFASLDYARDAFDEAYGIKI